MNFFKTRFYGSKFLLKNHSIILLEGKDRESFIQAHGTNDFNSLLKGKGHLTSRLNLNGQLQSFYYCAKLENSVAIVVDNKIKDITVSNFEKYIIMEDVTITTVESDIFIILSPFVTEISNNLISNAEAFQGTFAGEDALFLWGKNQELFESINLDELSNDELQSLHLASGWPIWNDNINQRLINETTLNKYAVSYTKGCFAGQETAAKVQNNRGASYEQVLLKSDKEIIGKFSIDGKKAGVISSFFKIGDQNYLEAKLFRDFRVENMEILLSVDEIEFSVKVLSLPLIKNNSRNDKAIELYEIAVSKFQSNDFEKAIELLEHTIELDHEFEDAYESLGVILGRQENYPEALEVMDKLISINSESIMAYTNKSLFFMKMGKIEEAEEQKSLATIKTFEKVGQKDQVNEFHNKEIEERERAMKKREQMFLQVLEIDNDDSLANMGMGEISFNRKNHSKTVEYVEKALVTDPSNAKAFLLLGKAYEALGKSEKAKKIYDKGFQIASSKGFQKEADEMYARSIQI